MLNSRLERLNPFPYTAAQQRRESIRLAGKLSIAGVQPKLSAVLSVKHQTFIPVEKYGNYILKPQHADYPQLPENEAITMNMARVAGLELPLTGLVYSADGSMTYFIRRFDRVGKAGKLAVEDFSQLAGLGRDAKYSYSMEKLSGLLDGYCTFPEVEKNRLFQRVLFCWLTGNDDMHLKNFSVISRAGKVELSPLYDCLNTSAVYRLMGRKEEDLDEMALPLGGRKRNITRRILVDYYGAERLGLTARMIGKALDRFSRVLPLWNDLLEKSFLSEEVKGIYTDLLKRRSAELRL